jgi:TonB family protein
MKQKQFLSGLCAAALLVGNITGPMALAQDKKQSPGGQETEKRVESTVTIRDGVRQSIVIARGDGQDPMVAGSIITEPMIGMANGFTWTSAVPQQGGDGTFQFFSQEMTFDARLVKGAPFSAETLSESIQPIADGNRIVTRNEGRIYRDSEGRSRQERSFRPGMGANEQQVITIFDPIAGTNITLDPATRTARKMPSFLRTATASGVGVGAATGGASTFTFSTSNEGAAVGEGPRKLSVSGGVLQGSAIKRVQPPYPEVAKAAKASGAVQVRVVVNETGDVVDATVLSGHPLLRENALEAARQWKFKPTELAGKAVKVDGILTFNFSLAGESALPEAGVRVPGPPMMKFSANKEDLGTQLVEGVECTGTRMTTTIPAGAIGNEGPIKTVTETWYSPELKMTILSKKSDPRFGETVYKVMNINRAEPEASLFQVPNDYTVKEGGSYGFTTAQPVFERRVQRPEEK